MRQKQFIALAASIQRGDRGEFKRMDIDRGREEEHGFRKLHDTETIEPHDWVEAHCGVIFIQLIDGDYWVGHSFRSFRQKHGYHLRVLRKIPRRIIELE